VVVVIAIVGISGVRVELDVGGQDTEEALGVVVADVLETRVE